MSGIDPPNPPFEMAPTMLPPEAPEAFRCRRPLTADGLPGYHAAAAAVDHLWLDAGALRRAALILRACGFPSHADRLREIANKIYPPHQDSPA